MQNKMQSFDIRINDLPSDIQFCKNCVVSNQRPGVTLNSEGVCGACTWSFEKDHVINWDERERELRDICDQHRSRNGKFDVIVPGSGGKDSAFVAHQLKVKYGMNPLCVTWAPMGWTQIGFKNLQNFAISGFSNVVGQPSGVIHRKLSKLAFELLGTAFAPFSYGQKSYAYHIAREHGIKWICYGENGSLEYSGYDKYKHMARETIEQWTEQLFFCAEVDRLVEVGLQRGLFSKEEAQNEVLQWYKPPLPEVIDKEKLEMHWFSYYKKWSPQENYYYASQYTDFNTNNEARSEGTYTKYSSLDDVTDGFHWYLSYMKFGLGRASRDAQTDIRRHHITREDGVALVRRYDGEFPKRHYKWFLNYLDISDEFFWQVMDFYREKSKVWKKVNDEWVMTAIVR